MKQGWTISTIGSVAKVFNGNSINAEEKKAKYEGLEEGYPFIATKDVGVNGEVDYDNGVKIPFDTDFKIAMPDAVFVCAEGGSAGKKVAHIDRKVCFGNKLFALQPIKEKVKGGFLYYAVQEAGFKAQFRLLMAGIIGGVSAKKFNLITIPIPPLSEQQRIVALLDAEFAKIDALKANAEKNLQNAKDLFQAALKKELEPKEGWNKKRFGDVCKYQKEQGHYPHLKYVGLENIETGSGKLLGLQNGADILSTSFKFKNGYVMYGRLRPYLKKVFVADFEGCCSTEIFPIETKELLPHLLMYWFLSDTITDKINATCSGCRMPRANMNDVLGFDISIPTLSEQQQIVARLDALNEKCKTLQSNYEMTLSLCEDLKQALLRKAFNGEI